MRLAIGIATRGRPAILASALEDLGGQSRQPDRIIVAYPDPVDIGPAPERFPDVEFVKSKPGLTRQRNTILDVVDQEGIIVFLDDDFFLHPEYLHNIERVFNRYHDVVVATGKILADGINGPGLTVAYSRELIAAENACSPETVLTPAFNAYGCNMSVRMEPVQSHRLRFDESLPLYGWYEDVDFSRQAAAYGRVVRVENALGVHLGSKSGRQSGVRLGYSQVANPLYLARKRSVPWTYAIASMVSRSAKNLVRSAAPEAFVDRRGRLRGNLRGWRDVINGRISPLSILKF